MDGTQTMTVDLEHVAQALYHGALPVAWRKRFYLTQKPLAAYVFDITK